MLSIVNWFAAVLLKRCTALAQDCLNPILSQTNSRYSTYIEGMVADIREQIEKCQQEDWQDYKIFLRSVQLGLEFSWGVFALTNESLLNAISLLFYASEQVLLLRGSSGTSISTGYVKFGTTVFSLLHYVTGNVGKKYRWALVSLDTVGRIVAWEGASEEIFGFREIEALGALAECIHIPRKDSEGRDLGEFIRCLCASPSDYLLNVNENRHVNGRRFWVFWINIPLYGFTGELIEVLSLGIPIHDPLIMNVLINLWNFWKKFFWPTQPQNLDA
jgi:PAS domain-containing protein